MQSRFFTAVTSGSGVSSHSCDANRPSLPINPFIWQGRIFSCMIYRILYVQCIYSALRLMVWWDETPLGSCGSVLWIRVMQEPRPPQFQISMPSLSRLTTVASWLKPGLRCLFPPQRRQLPKRLWAPMLQESHELTTGLNYKVAFLQRSAFVSVKLVRLFSISGSFVFSLFLSTLVQSPSI